MSFKNIKSTQRTTKEQFLQRIYSLKDSYIFISLVIIFIYLILFQNHNQLEIDSSNYINIATGKLHNVIQPFSRRILHPAIAGTIAFLFKIQLEQAFLYIHIISIIIFAFTLCLILKKTLNMPMLAIPLTLNPSIIYISQFIYMHDFFFNTLVLIYFYFLIKEYWYRSLAILFLLCLTREYGLVIGIISSITFKSHNNKKIFTYIISITILGFLLTTFAQQYAQQNIHHMHSVIYLITKSFYNILKNLGLTLWVNSYTNWNCTSAWQANIPNNILGKINTIKLCTPNFITPIINIFNLLTIPGVFTSLLFMNLFIKGRKKLFKIIDTDQIWKSSGLYYAIFLYLISTTLYFNYRYFSYINILQTFLLPYLLTSCYNLNKKELLQILVINLVLSWMSFPQISFFNSAYSYIFLILIALFLHVKVLSILNTSNNNCKYN